ncbi:MAG: hypothetical protein P9X24_19995 [Candidatus Hatepunaea meridiana]|nr:hypothetical protein [Candidatus Hatepunaea meridiana]
MNLYIRQLRKLRQLLTTDAIRLFMILIVVLLLRSVSSATEDDFYHHRFGYSLFNPNYISTPLDCGDIFLLQPPQLAILNLENCSDLIGFNPQFFHPDLVTAGRRVFLSSLYTGPRVTRVLWRGRPFRDARTGRSNLSLLPLIAVGGLRSTHYGALDGSIASGAIIDFQPHRLKCKTPVTHLTHRDGYYDFAPVEFIHSRQISAHSYITAGGLIPSSRGRFAHANYTGHILFGEYSTQLKNSDQITLSYMSNLNRTEIPFTPLRQVLTPDATLVNKIRRGDLDIQYIHNYTDNSSLELAIYRSESLLKEDTLRDYGRELGSRLQAIYNDFGLNLRFSRLDGILPGGSDYLLNEMEGTIGWQREFRHIKLWLLGGGQGWLYDRVRIIGACGTELNIKPIGRLSLELKQAVDPHSPEMIFVKYDNAFLYDDFQPAWNIDTDLPVHGTDKPPTITRGGCIGLKRNVYYGEIETAAFYWTDIHPVVWNDIPDSIITLMNIDDRYLYGWETTWRFDNEPYRAMISFVGMTLKEESSTFIPVSNREPGFRLSWETGWHKSFWNNDFETDISLSGKYIGKYEAYSAKGWEKIGGAYPLDIRFTLRIRNFNFYYGLHNWNAYPYYLVPGYKMIHKEEYWGINWMMVK